MTWPARAARLDHIHDLGADVLYLNPIHLAYTNHSYDSLDYAQVAPHFGTRQDVIDLADTLHGTGDEAGARRGVQPHGPQLRDLPQR